MLSYEIYNYYSFVDEKLKEIEQIFKILFDWREEYSNSCEQILIKILTANTNSSSAGTHYIVPNGGLVKSFDETMENLQKNFNAISVTIKYGEIKKEIETYKIKNNIKSDYIEEFFRTYRLYVRSLSRMDSKLK